MKSLIAIVVFFASVSVSAAELDGKAIVCYSAIDDEAGAMPEGWVFDDGKALPQVISTRKGGTVAVIVGPAELNPTPSYYVAEIDSAHWDYDREWVLNRKTLELKRFSTLDSSRLIRSYHCELAESVASLGEIMETARREKQKQLDEQMKDNKL